MKYLAAYLLVQLAKEAPEASDIKTVLEAAGIDADMEQINKLMSELAGKSIDDLVAQGSSKLASMPSVGAAPAAAAGGAAPAAAAKEEKKEEAKEESDEDMGFGLFD